MIMSMKLSLEVAIFACRLLFYFIKRDKRSPTKMINSHIQKNKKGAFDSLIHLIHYVLIVLGPSSRIWLDLIIRVGVGLGHG